MKKIYSLLIAAFLMTFAGCSAVTPSSSDESKESTSESTVISSGESKSTAAASNELPAGTVPAPPIFMHNGVQYEVDTPTPTSIFYMRNDGQNADIFTGEAIDSAQDKCISSEINLVGTLEKCTGDVPANELESTAYAGYQLYDDGETVAILIDDFDFVCSELRYVNMNSLSHDEYTLDGVRCLFTCSPLS